jgi:hypothetical protein
MFKKITLFCLVLVFLVTPMSFAGPMIPNTFSPGETISASKMNENFSSIENNTIDTAPRVVDANGKLVGYTISYYLLAMTYNGKKFASDLEDLDGHGLSFSFSGPSCTGTKYLKENYSTSDYYGLKIAVPINGDLYLMTQYCSDMAPMFGLSFYDGTCQELTSPIPFRFCEAEFLFNIESEFTKPYTILFGTQN